MYLYKAGVVGAGAMGAEITQVISYAGLPVVLKDVNDALVQKGLQRARQIYERRVQKGKMAPEEMDSKMALIQGATDYGPFGDVDIVVEAVVENIDVKKKVFAELDKTCSPTAIFASNTSALSISELGAATKRPEKVIGLHFFYPAAVMKLVEVIPGLDTSEETVTDTISFAETLRKLPVRVNECAGFLVNRLLMPYLNEAAYCLQEKSATAREIDQAVVAFGFPMGPFTLVDTIGLDVCRSVVQILLESYGSRMTPAPIWDNLYKEGRYGIKAGKGFYTYGNPEEGEEATLQKLVKAFPTPSKKAPFSVERLLLPMINEAVLCLQEQVSQAADIDLALLAGIGFPQEKEGLLYYADKVGLDQVLAGLEQHQAIYGERFWPAPLLRRSVKAGHLGAKTKRGFFTY